jgi:hypothetical protein
LEEALEEKKGSSENVENKNKMSSIIKENNFI